MQLDQSRLEWACAPLWRARAQRRADAGGRAGMSHDGMCETGLVFNLDVSGCATSCKTESDCAKRLTRVRGARFDVLSGVSERCASLSGLCACRIGDGVKEVPAHVSFSLFWFISHLFVL